MRPGDLVTYYDYRKRTSNKPIKREVMLLEINGDKAKIQPLGELRPRWVLKENLVKR